MLPCPRLSGRSVARLVSVDGCEEGERVDSDLVGEVLESLQREVAFTTFDGRDVGAVHVEMFRETVLGPAPSDAVGAEVMSDALLEFSVHNGAACKPTRLQSRDF
jgi:hypothetical protein